MRIKINLALIIAANLLISCNLNPTKPKNYNKTWVYIELEIKTISDTSDYYYFGQINQKMLEKLAHHDSKENIFTLSNVRYYDDSDKLVTYEDGFYNGTLLFRMKDIVKIEVLKIDPLINEKNEMAKD